MSTLDALAAVAPHHGLEVLVGCPRCQRLTAAAWIDGFSGVAFYCSWRCWGRPLNRSGGVGGRRATQRPLTPAGSHVPLLDLKRSEVDPP